MVFCLIHITNLVLSPLTYLYVGNKEAILSLLVCEEDFVYK